MNSLEDKKNKLNLELRSLLSVIDMIDGKIEKYEDYIENTLNEEQFLDKQIILVEKAKNRLIDIFRN
ncbi:MAG: hypothetical protein Q4E75_00015 [bacterium]|nr:hypothetical protein [bacterium]